MHRNSIECNSLPPGADLVQAMQLATTRLVADGWQPESGYALGFVFLQRGGARVFMQVTAVDPAAPRDGGHAFLAGHGGVTQTGATE